MAPLKILLVLATFLFLFRSFACAINVSHDGRAITIDGKRRVLLSGSIHYPRSTAEMWPDLIRKAKEGGLDAIETYVFWDVHEPACRQYDFDGNLDLIRFLKTVQDEGLYAVLRIGPYVCAEWNYGGFPVWLHNMPGIKLRTANDVFMNEMKNFTSLIVNMAKQENLFASQGGPIILAQINTCNGWYCDQFTPNNPDSPKMWTENWTGWFKSWGGLDPHRTAEDVAFAVASITAAPILVEQPGGPYITTSYDYDAPLDEYGNLNQPKWGHLKELHDMLHSVEYTLTNGNITDVDLGNSVYATVYATPQQTTCFLGNTNATSDATFVFQGKQFTVPAWSVSILPDCQNEGYNTAKVNAQTSVMVKEPNKAESQPESLSWTWRPEIVDDQVVLGKGHVAAHRLVDQKDAANGASDYLWYMTSVNLKDDDPIWSDNMTLRVNCTGQILHAFVNGQSIGSQWALYGDFHYVFEQNVKLNRGNNLISLLSVTVGLQNYGPMFDLVQNGIPGPVEIVGRKGDERVIKDLSGHVWSYKVGLHGINNKLFSDDSASASNWQGKDLPTNRTMTWYKTTFKVPLGTDPVAVDLQGLGKGEAWVNGKSIGRYWPSYDAGSDGCSTDPCDYRGPYDNNKCVSNCGRPTQRWYHVPRSFMEEDVNTLVLFEEFGGNPSLVNFQTVTVGSICAHAYEKKTLELACQDRPISAVKFASFGDPQGACGSFAKGSCEGSNDAMAVLQNACVGKQNCSIDVSENTFGSTTCGSITKRLAVEVTC
ncbi:hypothetical protein NL676_035957 [Syzygium grande]|nr:hypothetical protein NL676_035957 [Syzygium grande]